MKTKFIHSDPSLFFYKSKKFSHLKSKLIACISIKWECLNIVILNQHNEVITDYWLTYPTHEEAEKRFKLCEI